jgi:Conserved TM helix
MTTLGAVDYSRGVEDAWAKIATFIPKFAAFLAILLIGYFVAKGIAKIADRLLERVGFDKMVERGGVKKALEGSQFDASDILAKVAFWTVFLLVLQMAFGVFGTNPVSTLLAAVVAYLPKIFVAVVIIVVAAAIAAGVKEIIEASLGGLSYGRPLALTASAMIVTVAIFAALNQLEIAPAVVNGLFYATLAIIVGSAVIAIGGGGIQPMRGQWERALAKIEDEAPRMKSESQGASDRIQERFEERKAQVKTGNGHTGDRDRAMSGSNFGSQET